VVQKACEGLETRAWGLRPINQPILHRIGSLVWQADGIAQVCNPFHGGFIRAQSDHVPYKISKTGMLNLARHRGKEINNGGFSD
jgi:hypothetical protein